MYLIIFKGSIMTVIIAGYENIEVDISRLSDDEQRRLKVVAKEMFK